MDALLEEAKTLRAEVRMKQMAHRLSAEDHYIKDRRIGGAAKVISAAIGTGAFLVLVSQVGLDGKGSASVPPGAKWLYWLVLLLCIAGPVLTAYSAYSKDGDDADQHQRSSDLYVEAESQLDDFLRQYADLDSAGASNSTRRKEAEEKYAQIRQKAHGASLKILVTRAKDEARRRLLAESAS